MADACIVVVEDEAIVAMDIAATLRRFGYQIPAVVDSGRAAIDAVAAAAPDLVLMDIRLNGPMDGVETAGQIRARFDVPVVFLTAHADEATVDRSSRAAPYGYVLKPFDEGELRRAVEIALSRHRAERDLRWESEERMRLLIDAVRDYAIIVVDLDGRVASWNTGAERMTGYAAEEIVGKPLTMLYSDGERDAEALRRELREITAGGSSETEAWRVRKDGTRFLAQIVRSPIVNRAGRVSACATVMRDVTERRRLEAHILEAEKLDNLGRLAGGIAHDFNNMLMVIFSRAEVLARTIGAADPARRFVDDIRSAAMKSRDLTQQLLAAARRQVLQPKVTSVNEVVESAARLLGSSIGEDVVLRTDLQEELWPVFADAGKLHQVLMNLALNARDAMPSGGALTIETRNFRATPSYVRQHPQLAVGDYVLIVVSDTGFGIAPDLRAHIFDPFFSTKAAGTGLGLAVVKGIVEQTGGQVWLYSEVNQGTTFKIFLPRLRDAGQREQPRPEPEALEEGTETILLVEDETLLRTIIGETLEEHGYHVLSAPTPAEALAVSGAFAERIDLLLTDVIMPGMNGRALAERIATQRHDIHVLFMSGYTDNAIVHHGVLDAGVHFIEKPVPTPALLRAVREALAM
ncbi:MAG TPA: response regulator [Thermoanaerobaculia bacterium]|nr:response regulator [Thermoanaerobaculia bacterium]